MTNLTEIIEQAKGGSESAFAELLTAVGPAIKKEIRKVLQDKTSHFDDAYQEVAFAIWKNLAKYDPAKGQMMAWARTVAENTTYQYLVRAGYLRRNGVSRHLATGKTYTQVEQPLGMTRIDANGEEQTIEVEDRSADWYGHARASEIKALIEQLPAKRRQAIELHLQGFDPQEIADAMSIKPNAVYKLLHDAREQIAQALGLELSGRKQTKSTDAAAVEDDVETEADSSDLSDEVQFIENDMDCFGTIEDEDVEFDNFPIILPAEVRNPLQVAY